MNTIKDLLADCYNGHDDTQISSFMIIKNGGTKWGCYKQALRELHSRIKTLQGSWITTQRLTRELQSAQLGVDELRALEIDLELASVCEHANTVKHEAAKIYTIASSLKDQIGILTPEKVKELDQELWLHRIKVLAVQDILDKSGLSSSTRSMVQSLPKHLKEEIHECLGKPDKLVSWFIDYDAGVPEITEVSSEALKEISYVTDLDKSVKRLA